ncbi:MAG TPA: glycosyltransferase family 39 protein [Silvibacterium sp.]|nr:glycosyltransferase family 39 protein [Silvibacterium sp.]
MAAGSAVSPLKPGNQSEPAGPLPHLEWVALVVLCSAKLLLHVFTSVQRYGHFRDELYYMDLGRHLAFGYVDCAPLIAVYARVALMLGGSLAALRILPALAGTVLVALSILIARELGGRRYAQWLTGVIVLLCPAVVIGDSLLTMNAFEPLFWTGCVWVVARFLRTGDSRLWIWFGVLAGLGLENKHSTMFFGAAVAAALLLTEHRREFLKPWIWIGVAAMLALAAPNVVWQARHHYPMLEDMENVKRTHKNVVLGPAAFVWHQIVDVHPILFPVWLAGAIWLLWRRRWRVLGLTFVVLFVLMELMHGKEYYLFPIYPMVLAAGAVAIAGWLAGLRRPAMAASLRAAIVVVIAVATAAFLPFATWMLSPENFVAYARAIGFMPKQMETHQRAALPQPMADQFGWPEMVAQIAGIYDSLPPAERAKTGIIAGNYGEAGSVDFWGPKYGLPTAISGHQNYFFWGPPREHYDNFIVIQWSEGDVKEACTSYRGFPHESEWGMDEENTPIYLCMGAKFDPRVPRVWAELKHWN